MGNLILVLSLPSQKKQKATHFHCCSCEDADSPVCTMTFLMNGSLLNSSEWEILWEDLQDTDVLSILLPPPVRD